MRTPPRAGQRGSIPGRIALLALVCVALASAAAWLAPLGWPFELFVHFRPQYGVAAALVAVALFALRRPGLAALAALIAALQLWPDGSASPALASGAPCDGQALTVVTANLSYTNADPRPLLEWLAREPADLVLLQEVTPGWAAALEALIGYPHRRLLTRADPYGIGVLSRWPVDRLAIRSLAGDGVPALLGPLPIGGEPVMLSVVHAQWPLLPELMRRRDRSAAALAEEVRRDEQSLWIVGGDFNLTPYSPVFRRLLVESGLHETAPHRAWVPTWRADFWPIAMRIDHVLVSPAVCAEPSEVGPEIGSDHRPVRVRLRLPSRA
jgi:endonuclease/exonuclease/phosphatase (EEP) superfamily protein YafD